MILGVRRLRREVTLRITVRDNKSNIAVNCETKNVVVNCEWQKKIRERERLMQSIAFDYPV